MLILSPIGKLYGLVMDVRNRLYDRGVLRSFALGARTISVGNLTTGGTGKTPMVSLISEILLEHGETVCILTRGYGRANPKERVLVSDGERILTDAATGGDEPVELATRLGGRAIIVADADRLSAGRWAKEKFGVTAFVLDDGFQHRRVRRELDIVCVDATEPCGGGRVLPAGRLRESLKGLKRADAIVITRSDLVEDTSAIVERLQKRNGTAPIFEVRTKISGLISLEEFHAEAQRTQREHLGASVFEMPDEADAAAFCALGNPAAFFKSVERYLADTGRGAARLLFGRALRDHHSYTQANIDGIGRRAIEEGAQFLVTSAKDAVKLKGMQFSLPCFVAHAETVVDDREAFRRLVVGESS